LLGACTFVAVPSQARGTRLTRDEVGSLADQKAAFVLGITDVYNRFAGFLQGLFTLASLPRSDIVDRVDRDVGHNGLDRRRLVDRMVGHGGLLLGRRDDVVTLGHGPPVMEMVAYVHLVIPEERRWTESFIDLMGLTALATHAHYELVVVPRMRGISNLIKANREHLVTNTGARRTIFLDHGGFGRSLPCDFEPIDGAFGLLFLLHAHLLRLGEIRAIDAFHGDGRGGVGRANHELALVLIVTNELTTAAAIARQCRAVSLTELLLMSRRVNGEANGAVGKRVDYASPHDSIKEHPWVTDDFPLLQDLGHDPPGFIINQISFFRFFGTG